MQNVLRDNREIKNHVYVLGGGGGELSIMTYTGRLLPRGVPIGKGISLFEEYERIWKSVILVCKNAGKGLANAFSRGGVLLGILGRGVPPGSPNPDPISDQKL